MQFRKTIFQDKTLIRLVFGFLMVKLVVFIIVISVYYFFPFFCDICFDGNFINPGNAKSGLITAFQSWDAQHYTYLADDWYSSAHPSNAFYPLYPALIKILNVFLPWGSLVNALLVSNIFSVGVIILLYKFVSQIKNSNTAVMTCILFMAFPTAFYLHLAYSESLFIFLTLFSFYLLYTKRSLVALFFSTLLLPLTRPQGILTIVPFIHKSVFSKKDNEKNVIRKVMIMVSAFSIGSLSYFMIIKLSTGFYDAGFSAQRYFESTYSLNYLWHPLAWFRNNFIETTWVLHAINESIINRVFLIGFVLSLWFIYKYTDRTLFTYALVIGGISALSGDLVSFPRYMLLIFPLFIALASILKRRFIIYSVVGIFFITQITFLIFHTRNFWIA